MCIDEIKMNIINSKPYPYRPLGLFRFLLSFFVVLQHTGANTAPLIIRNFVLMSEIGSLSVCTFFTISGFVITESILILYRDRPKDFFLNRCLRLFPMYSISLCCAIIVCIICKISSPRYAAYLETFSHNCFEIREIIMNFIMTIDIFGLFSFYPERLFIQSSWTIRIEFFYYTFMAIIIIINKLLFSNKTLICTILYSSLFMCIISSLSIYFSLQNTSLEYAPFFIFGSCLYIISYNSHKKYAIFMSIICFILMIFQQISRLNKYTFYEKSEAIQIFIFLFMLFTFFVLSHKFMSENNPVKRIDIFMGKITYSMYLTHEMIMVPIALPMNNKFTFMSFIIIIISILSFSILFYFTTEPHIERIRDKVRGFSLFEDNKNSL